MRAICRIRIYRYDTLYPFGYTSVTLIFYIDCVSYEIHDLQDTNVFVLLVSYCAIKIYDLVTSTIPQGVYFCMTQFKLTTVEKTGKLRV